MRKKNWRGGFGRPSGQGKAVEAVLAWQGVAGRGVAVMAGYGRVR